MFEGDDVLYDLVIFYPPAIPTLELRELGYHPIRISGFGDRLCWSGDGGPDGLDSIRAFLSALPKHLAPHGRALLSVNPSHCSAQGIQSLCQDYPLIVERIHRIPGVMNAYVLARAG